MKKKMTFFDLDPTTLRKPRWRKSKLGFRLGFGNAISEFGGFSFKLRSQTDVVELLFDSTRVKNGFGMCLFFNDTRWHWFNQWNFSTWIAELCGVILVDWSLCGMVEISEVSSSLGNWGAADLISKVLSFIYFIFFKELLFLLKSL